MPATASRRSVSSCEGTSGSAGTSAAVDGTFTSGSPCAGSSWHHVGASRRRLIRDSGPDRSTLLEMSYAEDSPPSLKPRMSQEATALAYEWRKLTRAATAVAVLTSPAWFLVFWKANHWDWYWALLATFVGVIAFRGAVDVISHKLIPAPNLYGAQSGAARGGHRRAPSRLVLAHDVPAPVLAGADPVRAADRAEPDAEARRAPTSRCSTPSARSATCSRRSCRRC